MHDKIDILSWLNVSQYVLYCVRTLVSLKFGEIFNDIIGTKIQKYYPIFNKKILFSVTFDENTAKT